jgi:hypothetical protein
VVLTWYNVLADDADAVGCEVEEVELEEPYPVDGGRPAVLVAVVELEEAVESREMDKKRGHTNGKNMFSSATRSH